MGIVVFLQTHDGHGLALVFLDLLGQGHSQSLDSLLTAYGCSGVASFQTFVFATDALKRQSDLGFPALLGTWGRVFDLRQRLAYAGHLLCQHLTVTPRNVAVDKRERVNGPSRVVFHFSLICAKHPVAGLVHLENGNTCWAYVGLNRTQSSREGRDCGQARLGESS